MANECHPNPYPHDRMRDPTPGDWETDTGAAPALIYAPPAEYSTESILIAEVGDDGSEQSATNARCLGASARMVRMLRAFQRDMDKMGIGSEQSVYGPDAVDLLGTFLEEIESLFTQYQLEPSKRERADDEDEPSLR